jgi:hypothetical protein
MDGMGCMTAETGLPEAVREAIEAVTNADRPDLLDKLLADLVDALRSPALPREEPPASPFPSK